MSPQYMFPNISSCCSRCIRNNIQQKAYFETDTSPLGLNHFYFQRKNLMSFEKTKALQDHSLIFPTKKNQANIIFYT